MCETCAKPRAMDAGMCGGIYLESFICLSAAIATTVFSAIYPPNKRGIHFGPQMISNNSFSVITLHNINRH